jgi:small subunit ribosomal protein S1
MQENIDTTVTETAPDTVDTLSNLSNLKTKMKVTGTVKSLGLYGAFVDIGVGTNALIHISQLGKDQVNRVSDVLNEGDEVEVWVDKIYPDRNQIMVTMIEPLAVEWRDLKTGQSYTGTVKRLETYGAFIDIGAEREGLVHISELSHDYVKHPSEVVAVGDEVNVQVLGFSKRKRRIDLSMKNLIEKPASPASGSGSGSAYAYGAASSAAPAVQEEYEEEAFEEMPTAMEIALRRAMGEGTLEATLPRRKKAGRKSRKSRRRSEDRQDDAIRRTLRMREGQDED